MDATLTRSTTKDPDRISSWDQTAVLAIMGGRIEVAGGKRVGAVASEATATSPEPEASHDSLTIILSPNVVLTELSVFTS